MTTTLDINLKTIIQEAIRTKLPEMKRQANQERTNYRTKPRNSKYFTFKR